MHLPARVTASCRAALVLLALGPLVAACGEEESVSAGDVIAARRDDQFIDGSVGRLTLPTGRLEVALGEVTTSLEASDTRDQEAIEAPEGTTFIPLTWQYDNGTFGDYADYLGAVDDPVVTLASDGVDYRLPPPDATGVGSDSFYVLVNGDGEAPVLTVDYDGVAQTLDLATGDRDTGAAAALYDVKARTERTQSCAADVTYGRDHVTTPTFGCTTTRAELLPYAGGAWAADGHAWLVVSIRTSFRRWDEYAADLRSGAVYAASGLESTFRVGDSPATQVIEDRDDSKCPDPVSGCTMNYHLIFDVVRGQVPKRLVVEQDYEFTLAQLVGGGDGKQVISVPVTIDTALRRS